MTFMTALTANGDKRELYELTTFELNEVFTHSINDSLSVILTGIDNLFLTTSSE